MNNFTLLQKSLNKFTFLIFNILLVYTVLNIARANSLLIYKLTDNSLIKDIFFYSFFVGISILLLNFVLLAIKNPINRFNKLLFVLSIGTILNYKVNPNIFINLRGEWLSDLLDISYYLSTASLLYLFLLIPKYLEELFEVASPFNIKNNYKSDKAIEEIDDDKLKRNKFAEDVAGLINDNKNNNLTIGLFGEWGTGKSSILNLIKKNLSKEEMLIIDFIPWYFGDSPQDIIIRFLDLLNEKVKLEKGINVDLHKYINDYSKLLSMISIRPPGLIGSFKEVIELLDKNKKDLFKVKKKIEKELSYFEKTIVVFIDDIDRLDKGEIQVIFKLIRLVCDFPNIIYVLSLDEQMVTRALGELMGSKEDDYIKIGQQYLEKFIQIPIYIPKYEHKKIEEYVTNGIREVFGDSTLDKNNEDTLISTIIGTGLSLRNLNRYFNTLSFFWRCLKEEVNPFDLSLLILIKIKQPNLYKFIAKNKFYFTSILKANAKNPLKTDIGKFINDYQDFRDILLALSPFSAQLFKEEVQLNNIKSSKKRLSDIDYFEKYFIYGVPDGELSISEIIAFLNTITETHKNPIEINYTQLCEKYTLPKVNKLIAENLEQLSSIEFNELTELLSDKFNSGTLSQFEKQSIINLLIAGIERFEYGTLNSKLFNKESNIILAFSLLKTINKRLIKKDSHVFLKDFIQCTNLSYSDALTNELLNESNIDDDDKKTIFTTWIYIVMDESSELVKEKFNDLITNVIDLEKILNYIIPEDTNSNVLKMQIELIQFYYSNVLKYIDWKILNVKLNEIGESESSDETFKKVSFVKSIEDKVYPTIEEMLKDIHINQNRKLTLDDLEPKFAWLLYQVYLYGNPTLVKGWNELVEIENVDKSKIEMLERITSFTELVNRLK